MMRHYPSVLACIITLLLSACVPIQVEVKEPVQTPTSIDLTITATRELNPNSRGRPSPLVLTLYQLEDYKKFIKADYFDLAQDADRVLGRALVQTNQIDILPGESLRHTDEMDPETRYLGVTAGFIDIDHARWRGAVELTANQTNGILIRIEPKAIYMERPESGKLPDFSYSGSKEAQ